MTPDAYGDPWLFNPSGLASTPAATVNVLAGYWAVGWSLAYALAFVGLWWVVAYGLWRRRWFVSV